MTRRVAVTLVAVAGAGAITLTAFWQPTPLLVWNASASVPVGLYAVRSPGRLAVNDLVVVRPPGPLAEWLADGRYLPRGVPLIKPVGGLPGQTVCRRGAVASVDGTIRAESRTRDHVGRLLPAWSGCRSIGQGEIFLLNASEPESLDGRYFGPLPSTAIVDRAVSIWVEEAR